MVQTSDPEPYLKVTGVTKTFGRFPALRDVSFNAQSGEFLCILGPSGCGKTTLLRIVAGLETQDSGRVFFQGKDVSGLPVSKRNIGIVFQSYALFPNLTATENIGYGLKNRRRDREGIRKRVDELLELVGLQLMGPKYPAQLSGVQQQRVALARAMALSPDLLLLDEPLSALDAQVRVTLRSEVRQLQRRLGVSTVMVTHDQEEALTMADRILVMNQGRIVQRGTPWEVYNRPATPFVASFLGSMSFIGNGVKDATGWVRVGGVHLQVEDGDAAGISSGAPVAVAIRPEDVIVRNPGDGDGNALCARVSALEFRGARYRVTFQVPLGEAGPSKLEADFPTEVIRRLGIREDMELTIQLPADRIRVYAL
ncbi:MAG TPA: putative 2-aminoethylphosphonate ABC transporter ATP-binding protein [Candidatus Methylomirabilis sp.]|nr:putative 2-aminoethylphosphonate ABC transporter ATP-binding protein [Candidatus Methylomirabilis sp.]